MSKSAELPPSDTEDVGCPNELHADARIGSNNEIPFYANTGDDMRCVQACSRMILKHLLDREFSWEELDSLAQGKPGEATSPAAALMGMTKLGLEAALISGFDHLRFFQEGIDYVRPTLGDEVADWRLLNSDVEKERKISRDLLASSVFYECRVPDSGDLREYLEEGYMVFCGINPKIINDEEGYSAHSVLILGLDDTMVELHDPGIPPRPHRKVSTPKFMHAWENYGSNVRAVRLPS